MKTNRILIFLLAGLLTNAWDAKGQTREQHESTVSVAIQSSLGPTFRQNFSVPFVYEVDSLLGYDGYFNNPLDDPFGTLKGCFIFVGGNNDLNGNVVGIYKNGVVLWHSDTLNCMGDLRLFSTRDLNNDGKVELIFEAGLDDAELWIFSWDGHNGYRINAVADDNTSSIEGSPDNFGFIDVDGDGIWEIQDFNDEDGTGGWSWNGQEYGHWDNTPNTSIMFPPRNKVQAKVMCQTLKNGDSLQLNYTISNKAASIQKIDDFRIWHQPPIGGFYISSPPYWINSINSGSGGFVWWGADPHYITGQITRGSTQGGYSLRSKSICTIVPFDMHGFNSVGAISDSDFVNNPDLITHDDLSNSFWGETIGPCDPSSPFVVSNFVDSLSFFVTQSQALGWIPSQSIVNKYLANFSSAKSYLLSNNIVSARTVLQNVLSNASVDSLNNLTSEAYALIRYNTEYLLSQLPSSPPGFLVKLISSTGTYLTSGLLQYYDGSWKNATNNNDGTFTINTQLTSLSLRMTYAYGSQSVSNVPVSNSPYVFQTVNTQVKLQNSQGGLIDTGIVQYYAGAWRNFGTTTSGIATMELLPVNYSFSMTYAYASNNKAQDLSANPIVVFQTTNTSVQLKNSQGNLIDTGTVQYYSGAWRAFGTTTNGVTTKELLPNSYSFSMTYAYASNNKQQDIGANSTVIFQTVNVAVQLKNSQGNLIDQGTVQYYSGAWRSFGTTSGGVTTKELLPNSYSFSMTYAYASNNKQQDIGANSTVVFQTVNAAIQLKNSQGSLIDQGTVQYYSGAWRTFGTTSGGVTTKELLPNSYSFSMTYAFASNNKQQDLNSNPTVVFQTVNTTVQLKNSQGNLVDTGTVQYYSGAWRTFGTTTNGTVSLELLPNSYQFSMTYAYVSNNKTQDVGSNNTVSFSTVLATVNVINTQNNPVNNAVVTYYSGAWRQFGNTVNGNATKELLPASLQFRAQSGSVSQNKTQDLSTNPLVVITLNVGQ